MVWSKLQDRILPCLDRHWDMKAYSNTDVVSNKNRTIWKQLGITLFLRHLTTQERKECCCCAALLAAAACMKCQWDICYALLRELLVILLADRFDYYLVRHFFPLSIPYWKVEIYSSDDYYCYELAKGAWLEFHYHHWMDTHELKLRVDETLKQVTEKLLSDGDNWVCPENTPFLNMVLS